MTDYQFVGYRLNNYTGVTDIVSDRIYHGSRPPEGTTYPVINYFMVSRPNIAYGHGERPRYQISCRADNAGSVMDLAHQVHAAFNNVQGSFNGFDIQWTWYEDSQYFIEDNGIHHATVDVFLSYINST